MAKFKSIRKKKSQLSTTPIVDGQFVFTTDTRELFVDVDNTRLQCMFPVPSVPEQEPLTLRSGDREYYYDGSQAVIMDLNATIRIEVSSTGDGFTSLSGGGWYREHAECEVECVLKSGYQFDGWYDENFEWISGNKAYSFIVSTSRTLTARAILIVTPPDGSPTDEPTATPTPTAENTSAPTQGPTDPPTPEPTPWPTTTAPPTEQPSDEP